MKKVLALAKKFINIPSVSGDVERAVEILEIAKHELADFAFTSYTCNSVPSLLYRNGKEKKSFKIILNAHLDVVAGSAKQFEAYEHDGKLYGRGAYDMKAAAAVMILLFKEIGRELSYPLGLQLLTDEELASDNGTNYQIEKGVRTDFAIIGECGSNLQIMNESKGILTAEITTSGRAAHGAYPWRGQNAILRMNEVIALLQKHFPTPLSESFGTTLTISQIATTNKTWNKVPDNCTAIFDIRFNQTESKTILPRLISLLPKDVTLMILQRRPHQKTDPANHYIRSLIRAGEKIVEKEITVKKTFGGSDTTFFYKAGCDAIEFGPVGSGQHDDTEWVEISSLENYYNILKLFLQSLDRE